MDNVTDIAKTRSDVWDANLDDQQRWTIYYKMCRGQWQIIAKWIEDEYGIPAPSRSALYRFCARLRKLESAHRLESALAARDEAGMLVAAATDDEKLIAAYKTLGQDMALRGDAITARIYTQLAVTLADKAIKQKELALKAEAQKTKDETLRLAREKFEAAEKRLNDISATTEDNTLTDAERVERIKGIFGIK